ncbi:hypothetical protein R1flu_017428 [Riccia fluitans]|uniref:Uncharacterized protein n=1 Tax=Riccia fluitans TaxID=41844 RepID=A0ABD1ZD82_9MARC
MGRIPVLLARALMRSSGIRQSSARHASASTVAQRRALSTTFGSQGAEALEQETERKAGWMLKGIAAVTLTYVGFNVFPLMGDSMVKHSVALLRTQDPYFKRSGASRLTLIATDDDRRLRIVNAGGVAGLVNMLESATDDETRREAVKALTTISQIDAAIEALDATGVQPLLVNLACSSLDLESQQYATTLLERLSFMTAAGIGRLMRPSLSATGRLSCHAASDSFDWFWSMSSSVVL